MKMDVTLCLLIKNGRVLLARKKRGFGAGKYNGVGGKVETAESVEQAMLRETKEEIGVNLTDYEKLAEIDYNEFYKGEKEYLKLHLYISREWEGEPIETEEMKPEWFEFDKIPYDECFGDDRYWLPLALEGKKFKAFFRFDEDWNLLEKEVEVDLG